MEHPSVKKSFDEETLKLVIESQKGSRQAMSKLMRKIGDHLMKFCVYLTGDISLAEDLCQDCFVKVLSKIRALKEPGRFVPWLFVMARNAYMDHLKKPSVSRTDSLGSSHEGLLSIKEKDFELSFRISKALRALDPKDRIILLLVDQQGLSYAEVAEITGISEQGIISKIHRVRKAFADKFEKT